MASDAAARSANEVDPSSPRVDSLTDLLKRLPTSSIREWQALQHLTPRDRESYSGDWRMRNQPAA